MANNTVAGRRSQEESERTKARILDEAESLFARLGFGVSIRQIAKASSVHHHTVQHHFNNKAELYQAVLTRWDGEVQTRLIKAVENCTNFGEMIDAGIDELFDMLLAKRDWVALKVMAATGQIKDEKISLEVNHWINFIDQHFKGQQLRDSNFDLGLLLITAEGITFNHVLAQEHYLSLFGKDVTDKALKEKTKAHLKKALRALTSNMEENHG